MPLQLDDRALSDLRPLTSASATSAAVSDFCAQCLRFIEGGSSGAVYGSAAEALGVGADAVAAALMALSQLLLDAARQRASEADLSSLLADAALPEGARRAVLDFYSAEQRRLRAHLGSIEAGSGEQLRDLDWRLHLTVRLARSGGGSLWAAFLLCARQARETAFSRCSPTTLRSLPAAGRVALRPRPDAAGLPAAH